MNLVISVGAKRHEITINEDSNVKDLMRSVAATTQIKEINQKLIHKGVTLTKEPEKFLSEFGIKNGSKVMVIGKRYDSEEEAALKTFQVIEKDVFKISLLTNELEKQVDSISKGFLDEPYKSEAFKKIKKDLLKYSHLAMKHLETIDTIILSPEFADAKLKRKSTVDKLQSFMDRCECIISIVETTS